MSDLDTIIRDIIVHKHMLESRSKKPRFLAINKELYEELLTELKASLAYSELEASFLSKVEQLEKEIGRHDLKISVGMLFGMHMIISDVVEKNEFIIL